MAAALKQRSDRLQFFTQRHNNALRASRIARNGTMPEASGVKTVGEVVAAVMDRLSRTSVAGQVRVAIWYRVCVCVCARARACVRRCVWVGRLGVAS